MNLRLKVAVICQLYENLRQQRNSYIIFISVLIFKPILLMLKKSKKGQRNHKQKCNQEHKR